MRGTVPVVAPGIRSGGDTPVGPLEGSRPRGTNSLRAMQHAQDLDVDVIRPWRRATIAVSAVAAVELIALVALAVVLLGNPLAKQLRETTAAAAGPPRVRTAQPAPAKKASLSRADTTVMVLNGGGQAGAAPPAANQGGAPRYQPRPTCNAHGATPRPP